MWKKYIPISMGIARYTYVIYVSYPCNIVFHAIKVWPNKSQYLCVTFIHTFIFSDNDAYIYFPQDGTNSVAMK